MSFVTQLLIFVSTSGFSTTYFSKRGTENLYLGHSPDYYYKEGRVFTTA